MLDDVEKSYDFFRKNNFFDRTGKISQTKMNALLDALIASWRPAEARKCRAVPVIAELRSCRIDRSRDRVQQRNRHARSHRGALSRPRSPAALWTPSVAGHSRRRPHLLFRHSCQSTPNSGERLHGTLTSEAHVIFGNLRLLLDSAGSSLDRLVQVHALIYDSIEYDVLNRVYRQYVSNGPPARTVWTAQIEAGFKIAARRDRRRLKRPRNADGRQA